MDSRGDGADHFLRDGAEFFVLSWKLRVKLYYQWAYLAEKNETDVLESTKLKNSCWHPIEALLGVLFLPLFPVFSVPHLETLAQF